MFERIKEYFKFGAGRPPGTMWAMEKSYFEWKYKFPNKTEYAYLRLAMQSRYPLRHDISDIVTRCRNLDDAIIEAVRLDFGDFAARMFKPALEAFPLCPKCAQYRALSTVDALCYGCRNFGDLAICRNCRLYWKGDLQLCPKCGGPLSAKSQHASEPSSQYSVHDQETEYQPGSQQGEKQANDSCNDDGDAEDGMDLGGSFCGCQAGQAEPVPMERRVRNTWPRAEVLYTCPACGSQTKVWTQHNDSQPVEVPFSEPPGLGEFVRGNRSQSQATLGRSPETDLRPRQEFYRPRFDFTTDELFRFGITHMVIGRWSELIGSEKEAENCVLAVVQRMHEARVLRRELVNQFYSPLQLLLMARRQSDFLTVQKAPAFSKTGQRNFASLYDAYAYGSGGEAGFREAWKRLQEQFEALEDRRNIVSFTGGPGLTKETALRIQPLPDRVLTHRTEAEPIIKGEYWYLAYTFGRMGVEWKKCRQVLLKRDEAGKMYDLLDIELAPGESFQIYFDISHLPY